MRLFQALVAGMHAGCGDKELLQSKSDALHWLEDQKTSPIILAPTARQVSSYTYFVPDNVGDRKFDRQSRLIGKIVRPHRLVGGETMHYLWPIDDSEMAVAQQYAETLCKETRHLLALGWGIDQVIGNGRILTEIEVIALPGQRWRPIITYRPTTQTWRVPITGSLANLELVWRSFLRRVDGQEYHPPLKLTQFKMVSYINDNTLPPRSYAIFDLSEKVAFRQENVAKVAAMLRSVTIRCALQDTHKFPGGSGVYVAGHVGPQEQTPARFSYLPLPTIGHEHSDGLIRRLLVAEPFGGNGEEAQWVENRLQNATLRDEEGDERGALFSSWREESKRMVFRYVSNAREWCTVTPVILPGFDDGKYSKAEGLLNTAMRQANLPLKAVVEITMRKAPFWPGSKHPCQYFVPNYLQRLPRWHVRLVFNNPVPGPLAVGAGRHAGLGLFARIEE